MGVFTRGDSPYYWLFLETTKQKEKTEFKIGRTVSQRRDSRKLAEDRYHQRMNELAARLYKLPSALPAIRFTAYADTYVLDVIAHRKGAERERELLKPLRAFFGDDLLALIDPDRVRAYMTERKQKVSARTVNREVDLLKGMLRDAAPKYLTASPIVGLKRLQVVDPKRRMLAPAEEDKLLRFADSVEKALLILGIDGLIRLNDLLDLKRSDRRGVWLYVADPKGGEPYEAVLTDRAVAALEAIPGREEYYFERYRAAKTDRDKRARVRRVLMKVCAKAGVRYGKKTGGITFHWATRKTGATRLIQRRVPVPDVQKQGNWKTPDVLMKIYAEADRESQKRAIRFPLGSRSKRKSA